jgi:poly-D-alanine transfer protein DltD
VTAWDSLRVLKNREKIRRNDIAYRKKFLADGVLAQRLWTEKEWSKRFPKSVKRYSDLYRNAYKRLDPEAQSYFERTLKLMNDQGATPLIVLTPINPKLLAVVGPLGWPQRHQQVVDYVTSLKSKYDFVFVDLTDIKTFGADPQQFYDGVHMTTINTQRAIDYVLKKTGGIPK